MIKKIKVIILLVSFYNIKTARKISPSTSFRSLSAYEQPRGSNASQIAAKQSIRDALDHSVLSKGEREIYAKELESSAPSRDPLTKDQYSNYINSPRDNNIRTENGVTSVLMRKTGEYLDIKPTTVREKSLNDGVSALKPVRSLSAYEQLRGGDVYKIAERESARKSSDRNSVLSNRETKSIEEEVFKEYNMNEKHHSNPLVSFFKGIGNRLGLRKSPEKRYSERVENLKKSSLETINKEEIPQSSSRPSSSESISVVSVKNTPPPPPSSSSKPKFNSLPNTSKSSLNSSAKESTYSIPVKKTPPPVLPKKAQLGIRYNSNQVKKNESTNAYEFTDGKVIPEGYQLRKTADGYGLVKNPFKKPIAKKTPPSVAPKPTGYLSSKAISELPAPVV